VMPAGRSEGAGGRAAQKRAGCGRAPTKKKAHLFREGQPLIVRAKDRERGVKGVTTKRWQGLKSLLAWISPEGNAV